jgi:hypothetical protein
MIMGRHKLSPRKAKFMRKATASTLVGLLIGLSACASYNRPIEPPVEGYQAIRFKQPVSVRDHAINTITFPTGSTFVADRQFEYGTVYCGLAISNEDRSPSRSCVGLEGDTTLVIYPDSFKMVRREIPAGSVERFRMK